MTAQTVNFKMASKAKRAPRKESRVAKNQHTSLILRTCNADMSSRNGFVWPVSGHVQCPDWSPVPECGNGLHGLLWGEGDNHLDFNDTAKWLVVEVLNTDIVDLGGKVKFPRGTVVHVGNRLSAVAFIAAHPLGRSRAIVGGIDIAGNHGKALAGHRGTATAGHRGTALAGNGGTALAGECGTATAGNCGTATAGNDGTATAGHYGTALAGDRGTALAGNDGTATAGNCGTATAGHRGTATAGVSGTIMIKHWDGNRYRIVTGYIGEDGLLPNVKYKLSDDGKKFVVA
ncbi:hypothetical protein UFOVP75_46 [uncultured Caudovirales phage]|uniref:DUF7666 domain-containing protein n=1 Tax=uncultured Caudovirales phage TaxID=2100421 RepID=A0A6J5KWP8_9CAUD|nr:hypothetical protein UFOVP75_46 [uncultured Caudovirales phage]